MSTNNPFLEEAKGVDLSTFDPELLNNLQFIFKDVLSGDPAALARPEFTGLNVQQLKTALEFILTNQDLDESQKADLLSNSWRLNYRDRPPTPEEFLTERYLGPVAQTIWPQVKQAFIDFMNPTAPYRTAVLYSFIGFGKMERNDCNIKTYEHGDIPIGDIQVGEKVCTPDGSFANVIKVSPQGRKEIFRATFSDGRETYIGREHLWKAAKSKCSIEWNKQQKKYMKKEFQTPNWKTITTQGILESIEKNPKDRWFIPLTEPVLHKANPHIISPYTLGALLGDGYFGSAVTLVGDDEEIHARVEKELSSDVQARISKTVSCDYQTIFTYHHTKGNPYKKELGRLGLRETRSNNKFIPEEYLYDSIWNRIALLQGLMDTDGTAVKRSGLAVFNTTSEKLRDNMLTLVRGLGGLASWSRDDTIRPHCKINFPCYFIFISFPSNKFPIFSLKRKQDIVDYHFNRPRTKRKTQVLYLSRIEQVEDAEATCIMIDHPECLYLTDDYIVTHNSFLAVLVNLYIGTHLSMMRSPWRFFGHSPATIYAQAFCATSQKKSSELLFEPMLNMLESSPFFEKVHTKEGMANRERDFARMNNIDRIFWTTAVPTSALQFSGGANFKLIAGPHALLGQTLISGTMTELTFFHENGRSDDFIFKFFTKLRARIESRMKGNYFGRFILDSSPNTLESPVDDWVVHEAPKNPSNFIISGSRWKWVKGDFPPETFDELGNVKPEKAFQVFLGGKGRPPMIIDSEDREQFALEDVIDVPDVPLIRGQFEENIYEALKDQAGIPAGSSDKIFYDYSKIEHIFDPHLKSVYTHIVASSRDSPEGIIWNQIKDQFFIKYINSYQFWYKPHVPRVFAVDQSISGDVTAIALAHLEREMRKVPGMPEPQMTLIYVVDLVVPITPKGGRINLDAIRYFIEDLREKGSMQLMYGSFDQFQSEATMQYLLRRGFEIEKLSVDKEMDPYLNFVSIIESDRLRAGRNIHLKNNLKSLQIIRRKDADGKKTGSQKVDHTSGEIVLEGSTAWETSLIGIHAKDISDAVCACCELLRKHDVVPYEMWAPELIKERTREDAKNQINALLEKNKWGVAIST